MAFEPADPAMKIQLKIDRKRTTETFTRDSQIDYFSKLCIWDFEMIAHS